MNKAYKLVWNTAQQLWVVASELGKSRKKTKAPGIVLALLSLGLGQLAMAAPATRAIPVLDSIASGNATVTSGLNSSTGRSNVTVAQSSDKLIANWSSFDVGQLSEVIFNQPTITSIALNRISGVTPSQIFGRVQANGQLVLVNPAGMVFGSSGRVNAVSIVASTLDITDANFNAGILQFDRGNSIGTIDNKGIIQADAGNAFIFAPTVINDGSIRATAGNVTLANGNRLTVDGVAGSATLGQVSGIAGLIQSTGVIRGDRITTTDKGKVFLIGDRARGASVVNLAGEITSSSTDIKGKTVNIVGDLLVNANTGINASGSIYINAALSVNGNNRLLTLGSGSGANDTTIFGDNGKVNLPGMGVKFRINDVYYKIIKTLNELQFIGFNNATLSDKYVLGQDVDATSTSTIQFNPLGASTSDPFSGILDGLGHQIINLTINRPTEDEVGLVGYALGSTIRNLNLNNVAISGQSYVGGMIGRNGKDDGIAHTSLLFNNKISGSISGTSNIGGLVGCDAVYNTGTSSLTSNQSNAKVSGTSFVGNLIGSASIYKSTFNIVGNTVNGVTKASSEPGNKNDIGGIAGQLNLYINSVANISDNIVNGDVAASNKVNNMGDAIGGAYIADSVFNLKNTHTFGSVNATADSNYTGGLLGYLRFSGTASSNITMISAGGNISAGKYVGGLLGFYGGDSNGITNSYATGNVAGQDTVGGLIGWSSYSIVNNSYATGSVAGVNSAIGGLIGANNGGKINTSHASGAVRSGNSEAGGLIGRNTDGSVARSYATGDVTGLGEVKPDKLGGLIGSHTANVDVFLDGNYATGNVAGDIMLGGLIGTIDNKNKAISKIINNFSTGNVAGSFGLGGLIGSLSNASGKIYLSNTYANGTLSSQGDYYSTGGLVGSVNDNGGLTFISNSYWDRNLSGQTSGFGFDSTINGGVTNLTGLTTAQSKQLGSYAGWDISSATTGSSSIWYINNGVATPVLRSLMGP